MHQAGRRREFTAGITWQESMGDADQSEGTHQRGTEGGPPSAEIAMKSDCEGHDENAGNEEVRVLDQGTRRIHTSQLADGLCHVTVARVLRAREDDQQAED